MRRHCRDPIARAAAAGKKRAARARDSHLLPLFTALYRVLLHDSNATIVHAARSLGYRSHTRDPWCRKTQAVWSEAFFRVLGRRALS